MPSAEVCAFFLNFDVYLLLSILPLHSLLTMPGTHMEVHVGAKSFGHLLGFLSGKGLAVNFDASAYCLYFLIAGISPCVSGSITIVGPESTPPTFTENNKPELLLFQPLPHRLPCMSCGQTVKTPWYAIIRGLEVGVRHTW